MMADGIRPVRGRPDGTQLLSEDFLIFGFHYLRLADVRYSAAAIGPGFPNHMVLRFAGFELDSSRAELRGANGDVIKLRPKTLSMLTLFAANAGRVMSKHELMEAVWPNVHVGDDSLFQCIREIRTALGDDRRLIVRSISGRGYLFEAEIRTEPPVLAQMPLHAIAAGGGANARFEPAPAQMRMGFRHSKALAFAGLGVIMVGSAALMAMFAPGSTLRREPIVIAVMPFGHGDGDNSGMASEITTRLSDGLAKIGNIRVSVQQTTSRDINALQPEFIISGDVQRNEQSSSVRARMTRTATGEVVWIAPASGVSDDSETSRQQSRLAASIGHPLALGINKLIHSEPGRPAGDAKIVIEQATASITQTTRERFAASQTMLEKALAGDPDNVDLAVALAAIQLRGVQMVWYNPADSAAAETKAKAILERALKQKPSYIPVLEAYCRFLNTTNQFVESLVACAKALNFDPWNGVALYHIGLAQVQLGRFEDALTTFQQADSFDTPQVSRWTWRLGAGMTYLLMGKSEDALPWLQSSIGITPASGRSYMLLSAAYQRLGRTAEAKTEMDKALALRPGSNIANVALPPKNASPVFLAALASIVRANVDAGLPEN